MVVLNNFPPPLMCVENSKIGCDEEQLPMLAKRLVVQLRSGSQKLDGIKGILAATGVDATFNAALPFANVFGVVAQNARARLHHVIIYSIR